MRIEINPQSAIRPPRRIFDNPQWLVGLLAAAFAAGCQAPPKKPLHYPQGALKVRYESAGDYSTCLVASVSMAANYLVGDRKFSEPGMRAVLKQRGLDEMVVGDLQSYMESEGLHLFALRQGRLDAKPPAGLCHWLQRRGYPVICVINSDPTGDEGFNHAVVVIGVSASAPESSGGSRNPETPAADIVHYLDPATDLKLHSAPAGQFEEWWGRCDRAMLLVVAPPGGPP